MKPILLPPNIIDHFYRGGTRLAELRGVDLPSPRRPEEWLAATVHRAGEPTVGPSHTADGAVFADLVANDPVGWIGPAAAPTPTDTGILVKLLDAAQRLPVHVHPTRPFAAGHLHSCYGKTEAWYVLDAEGDDAAVWVGFAEPVEPAELARRVEAQDSAWMLGHLNRIDVRPGDGILVPGGTAHAIGAGVFVVEIQEPTDFSILLEWSVTTVGREDSHLELGLDVALGALDHGALDPGALTTLLHHTAPTATSDAPIPLLSPTADPYFRLDLLAPADGARVPVPGGFAVAVVLDGVGQLVGDGGDDPVPVERGQVWAVPAGFGDWTASGALRIVLCRPSGSWPANLDGAP